MPSPDRQGLVDAFAAGHYLRELPLFLPALRNNESSCLWDYSQEEDVFIFLEPLPVCFEKYSMALERWQADFE